MNMQIQPRAEIGLRSLGKTEQKRIARALDEIAETEPKWAFQHAKLYKLSAGLSAKKLYAYQASTKLRVILSLASDTWIVEDIIDEKRLNRLLTERGLE